MAITAMAAVVVAAVPAAVAAADDPAIARPPVSVPVAREEIVIEQLL